MDSDLAGDPKTCKPTTGVVMKFGGMVIKTYSRNQKTIALSSGEAELYAIVSGISEAIRIQSLISDLGVNTKITCFTDSNAAIRIVKRAGVGKVRHMNIKFLWVQEALAEGRLTIQGTVT